MGVGGVSPDQVSVGVLFDAVPRDAVDERSRCVVRERRSNGKLPAHVSAYLTLGLSLFPDDDYEEAAAKVTGSLDRFGCWDAAVQYLQRARAAGGVLWIPVVFVAFWSSGYLVGDIGTRAAPPLALLFWRFAVALAVVTVIAFATTAPWPRGWRAWAHLAVVGVLLQTTQFAGVYFALARGTSAGLAALLVSGSPLVISALAVPLFGERLLRRQWLGLLIGLVGVAAAVSAELSGGGGLTGVALVLLGAVGFIAGTLYQKRFGQTMDLRTGGAIQLLAATASAAMLVFLHGGGFALPLTGWRWARSPGWRS